MQCKFCKADFKPAVFWQRFCRDECRRAFHIEQTKRGRALLKERDEKEAAA
jgi:hypothetical protein